MQHEDLSVMTGENFEVVVGKNGVKRNSPLESDSDDDENANKRRAVAVAGNIGLQSTSSAGAVGSSNVIAPNNTQPENDVFYIKGSGYNLVASLKRQLKLYLSELTAVLGSNADTSSWKMTGDLLRVTVKNRLKNLSFCKRRSYVGSRLSYLSRGVWLVHELVPPRANHWRLTHMPMR